MNYLNEKNFCDDYYKLIPTSITKLLKFFIYIYKK